MLWTLDLKTHRCSSTVDSYADSGLGGTSEIMASSLQMRGSVCSQPFAYARKHVVSCPVFEWLKGVIKCW